MTASSSNWEKTSKLKDRINNLLDFTPDIKIRKLEQGTVQVNDYYIQNQYGLWKCSTESFFRRKSAVGYALCLIKNDNAKAKQIKELDRRLQKVKTDIDFYYYHMPSGKPNRKTTIINLIIANMTLLHNADTELTQLLKILQV